MTNEVTSNFAERISEETRALAASARIEGDGYLYQLQQAEGRREKLLQMFTDENLRSKLLGILALLKMSDFVVQIGYDRLVVVGPALLGDDTGAQTDVDRRLGGLTESDNNQFKRILDSIVLQLRQNGLTFPIKIGDAWFDVNGAKSDRDNSDRFVQHYGHGILFSTTK